VEGEQELVGGFHTEYNALKFGMFFLAEYAHMITASALMAVLFFGGWHFPWIPWAQPEATSLGAVFVKIGVISAKIVFSFFLMMWLRWTLPRFRYDQLMRLAWKSLIPLTLALFVLAAALLYFGLERSIWALVGNIVLLVLILVVAGTSRSEVTGRASSLAAIDSEAIPGPVAEAGGAG